jgi:hypothetical protein
MEALAFRGEGHESKWLLVDNLRQSYAETLSVNEYSKCGPQSGYFKNLLREMVLSV